MSAPIVTWTLKADHAKIQERSQYVLDLVPVPSGLLLGWSFPTHRPRKEAWLTNGKFR